MPQKPPQRTQLIRLLKGLFSGRLDEESLFADIPLMKFNVYSALPGYIESNAAVPVSGHEFLVFAKSMPAEKLKLKFRDTLKETVLQYIRLKLENDDADAFRFLLELIPADVQLQWKKIKNEKQKEKKRREEAARQEQERIGAIWATLHPLNQEWGIPPPPTLTETKTDHRLADWVNKYQPYMYIHNGTVFRKMTTNRTDSIYIEVKAKPSEGRAAPTPLQSERGRGEAPIEAPPPELSEREKKIEERRIRNEKYMVEYKKRFIGTLIEDQPVPPPIKNTSNFKIVDPVDHDTRIKQIANAMRELKR